MRGRLTQKNNGNVSDTIMKRSSNESHDSLPTSQPSSAAYPWHSKLLKGIRPLFLRRLLLIVLEPAVIPPPPGFSIRQAKVLLSPQSKLPPASPSGVYRVHLSSHPFLQLSHFSPVFLHLSLCTVVLLTPCCPLGFFLGFFSAAALIQHIQKIADLPLRLLVAAARRR